MLFRQIYDDKLAQYAYLVGCPASGEALLIDPERDVDRYLRVPETEGLTIRAVAETHIHADFLSGARELADRLGATVYVSAEGGEDWDYRWVDPTRGAVLLRNGDTFRVGSIEVRALHTPGHTPEHLAFLLTDRRGGASQPMGIVSGDFVFVGDLGRPDLLETAARVAGTMKPAARRLFASLQGFLELPEFLQVWPAHGAGSACGKSLGAVPQTTVGYEKRFNPAVAAHAKGEDTFVEYILKDQPEPPLYFARMKRQNRFGPPLLGDLPSPRRLTVAELRDLASREDVVVVDTRRSRSSFLRRHLPGSLYAPLDRTFATAIGSLVEDETLPLVLLVEAAQVEEAVRVLVRIGYDDVLGFADAETVERYHEGGGRSERIEEIDFAALERLRRVPDVEVLDVRYASEYATGHVPDALNVSYTRLPEREPELPRDAKLLVHCGSGARASIAAAYLARTGRRVACVNDAFARYAQVGRPEAPEAVTV